MCLKLSENCDISCNKIYWYIFNHEKLKLCKIKRDDLNERIFNELLEKRFINHNVIKNKYVNDLLDNGFLVLSKIEDHPKSYYNKRQELYLRYLHDKNKNYSMDEYYALIKNSHVTIIGCGAIGSYLAMLLSAIQIGKLTLIDGDVVDESNLMRQLFFDYNDIDKSKVNSLKKKVISNSKKTEVDTIDKFIDISNCSNILSKSDLIIQTADTPKIVLDLIVEKWADKNDVPVLFTHRNTIGPLYIPGESIGYSYFIKKINKQTDGAYIEFLKTLDFHSVNNYPAIPHGPLLIAHYLYDEVLSYITKYKETRTINRIIGIGPCEVKEIMSYANNEL